MPDSEAQSPANEREAFGYIPQNRDQWTREDGHGDLFNRVEPPDLPRELQRDPIRHNPEDLPATVAVPDNSTLRRQTKAEPLVNGATIWNPASHTEDNYWQRVTDERMPLPQDQSGVLTGTIAAEFTNQPARTHDPINLQQQLQCTNDQAAALSERSPLTASSSNTPSAALPADFSAISKKLDDAAIKLDKAASNYKTLVLLKD
jgi:hypothetical protein